MPRRTNPFQELIALVFLAIKGTDFTVEESILTPKNLKTGSIRELDIVLTNKRNPDDKVLIECRAHVRKQSIEWIDALVGKSQSVGYKKVIAVSKSGFFKPAILEAQDKGILTMTLDEAIENDWKHLFSSLKKIKVEKISNLAIRKMKIIDIDQNSYPIYDPSKIRILKKKNKEWITILDLIKGQATNIKSDFDSRRTPNIGTKIIITVPLESLYFQFRGNSNMYYAKQLEIEIEEYNDTFEVPLKPHAFGDEKLLIGEVALPNSRFRLVFNLSDDKELLVAVEEKKIKIK